MSAVRIGRPGEGVRLVADADPYAGLTPRQRQILDVVRSFNGNRSRAARHLRVRTTTVQCVLRRAADHGAVLPPIARRGRDLRPRTRTR